MLRCLVNVVLPATVRGLLACALASCGNDLDALHCDRSDCPREDDGGKAGSGAQPPRGEPPLLPALPDLEVRAACEACAEEKCSGERASCLEDDACTAMLRCKGKAADPARLEACDASNAFSIWYRDYFDCVHAPGTYGGRCGVECATGENWDCIGNYEFAPAAANEAYDVDLHFVGPWGPDDHERLTSFPPLAGATVLACAQLVEDCVADGPNVLASAGVGAYGNATLALRGLYSGFFRIAGGANSENTVFYDLTYTGSQRRDLLFLARSELQKFGLPFPLAGPDRSSVRAAQVDCLRLPAPGIRLGVTGEGDVDTAYFSALGLTGSFDRTEHFGSAMLGIELNGESTRMLELEGRPGDGGEALSRRQVEVGLGWSTVVLIPPLERGRR